MTIPPNGHSPGQPARSIPSCRFPRMSQPTVSFDMAGNVQEWTKDWYDSKYFQQFANRMAENPVGPDDQTALERSARRGQGRLEDLGRVFPRGRPLRKAPGPRRLSLRAARRSRPAVARADGSAARRAAFKCTGSLERSLLSRTRPSAPRHSETNRACARCSRRSRSLAAIPAAMRAFSVLYSRWRPRSHAP